MKSSLWAAALLSLAACGTTVQPDARLALIQQQHTQLLAKQKQAESQYPHLTAERVQDSQAAFADLVQVSGATLQTIDHLDPAKSQDAAQQAQVGQLATQEAHVLDLADNTLKLNQLHLSDRPPMGK